MLPTAIDHLPSHPCYLNGSYTPLNEAKVSVLDRGFIFGDGIYEVVPVYAGHPFRFAQHMARLERSLSEMRIANPLSRDQWLQITTNLVANYPVSTSENSPKNFQNAPRQDNFVVYFQITRGVAMRDHVMPKDITPTVFGMCNPMPVYSAAYRAQGVACVTHDDFRWQKAHIKSTSLLGSVMARQISFDAGAKETVMFRDGSLSEAAHSNVWVVKNNTVYGAPKDNLVLEGIRYGLIAQLCQATGLGFELKRVSRAEVLSCDELLLSSATAEVMPVTQLDGQLVGHPSHSGQPGPVYTKLYAAYQTAKEVSAASAVSTA
jgi:D-alanine transaminase